MKTNELTGAALDWAVAKADENLHPKGDVRLLDGKVSIIEGGDWETPDRWQRYSPSTNWAQGGPIIEREMLCVGYRHQADPNYCPINDPATICWSRITAGGYLSYGPTPLIAAMRCYVASKLGDEVEVPGELAP